MHFGKPLIISDNLSITLRIIDVIREIDIEDLIPFSFACTNKNYLNDFLNGIGNNVQRLDLKNIEDVKFIAESFDLVISVHCQQLFPLELINAVKCINLHPGYNPLNRGWYPQVFAIINEREVGATLHEIDPMIDHGNIIDRIKVPYHSWDTSLSLYNRIVDAETKLFKHNIIPVLKNSYFAYPPEEEGNMYLKKDFKDLCELNLDEIASFKLFINRLRALTHGEFKNAYYVDPSTGKKVFVKVSLELEGD